MLIYERICLMSRTEILRNQKWRLGIIRHAEEVTHNIAKTCRYFGISRTAFYKGYEKYKNYGVEGLEDRSCRPLHSPQATKPEIIAKIIYLRQP
jgi:transposase-like protein